MAADQEGNLVKGTVTKQSHQICKNLSEILKAANSDLEKVVKVTLGNTYLTAPLLSNSNQLPRDKPPTEHPSPKHALTRRRCGQVYVGDFSILPEFNKVYNDYFPQKPPRTSVEVSRLPLDVQIEVDVTAASKI